MQKRLQNILNYSMLKQYELIEPKTTPFVNK